MSEKARYVAWRQGRPRFKPGPRERMLGFRSRDLRHADDTWFTPSEVIEFSRRIAEEIAAARVAARAAGRAPVVVGCDPLDERGYVYFLRCGERVKIGFSKDPLTRARHLSTGMPAPAGTIIAVRGTREDELRLHRALAAHRQNGEWFAACAAVSATMGRAAVTGRIDLRPIAQTENKVASATAPDSRSNELRTRQRVDF